MNHDFFTLQPDTFGLNQKTNFQMLFYHQSDIEAHTHAFLELVYILSGSAVHSHDGMTQMLSAGDYFIIDIGSVHSYQAGEDFSLYNFLFLPEFLDETMVGCTSFKELIRHGMYRYNKISHSNIPLSSISQEVIGYLCKQKHHCPGTTGPPNRPTSPDRTCICLQ